MHCRLGFSICHCFANQIHTLSILNICLNSSDDSVKGSVIHCECCKKNREMGEVAGQGVHL